MTTVGESQITTEQIHGGAMRVGRFGLLEVRHDPAADALYVKLADGTVHFTADLSDDCFLDYSTDGVILGIEVLGVRQGVALEGLPRAGEVGAALRAMGIATI